MQLLSIDKMRRTELWYKKQNGTEQNRTKQNRTEQIMDGIQEI